MNTPQYRYEQQQQKKAAEAINVAQIVKVTAYDGAKQTVDVQPISKRLEQGTYQSQPPILGVPIVCDRGGGFAKKVAYKAGDIGLVVFCDHDIDNAVSSGTEGEPNTERNHSATDAIFIGGILPGSASNSLPDGYAIREKNHAGIFSFTTATPSTRFAISSVPSTAIWRSIRSVRITMPSRHSIFMTLRIMTVSGVSLFL